MIKVRNLEKAIESLPKRELARFRRWFAKFDNAQWDSQIREDVKKGKLEVVSEKALEDFKKGKFKEL